MADSVTPDQSHSPARPVAVHCAELTKIYGEGENQVHALRGVDLDICGGELLMLVGPSGCGKTTLISVIAGILRFTNRGSPMKRHHYLIPLLAAAGVAITAYTVALGEKSLPVAAPVAEPAKPPFAAFIAGSGLIEASTENIGVSTDLPGVVAKVLVKVGDQVTAGQPLFVLDDRQARAEVTVQEGLSGSNPASCPKNH